MDSIERCNKLFVANILQQIIMATVRRIGEKNDLTMKTMINSTESLKTIPTIPKDMVVKELINKFETFKLNNELLENVSNKGSDLKLLIEDLDREVRAILRQMVLRMVMDTVRTFEPRTRLHHGCTVNYKRKEAIYRTDDDCSKDDCIAGDDDTADDNYIADDDYTEDNHYREDDDDYRADDDYRKDDEYRADDKVNGKHMKERFNTRLLKVFIGIFCCFSKSSKYR
ncbi:uncharacterized protein LOC127850789 isoform X2 [Dreissena polymorpha]|uniref:uncharacterized protein LOC127850789 isoform X2 n=1 Tax=Dreissena polymorpha TaxID=45954 RepID=UPI0022646F47|nr:uncharacterized protein LOC127850789 isoform X2 [Dreissena polymorpha]